MLHREFRQRRRSRFLPALLAILLAGSTTAPARSSEPGRTLGHPGYIVIVGAAAASDTGEPFRWQDGPGTGQRSLVWSDGMLSVPAEFRLETFGPEDLAVPCGPDLAGGGHGGNLVFSEGTYEVTAPLLLSDGTVTLHAAAGELEILGQRVLYRAPPRVRVKDPRASYLLLAGLVLLTLVLLRRARQGFSSRSAR